MNPGALSPAEIDALLAGTQVQPGTPARADSHAALQAALDTQFRPWLRDIEFMLTEYSRVDGEQSQMREIDAETAVACDRALAASLVDYCYGGDGAADIDRASSWSVSERQMAGRVLDHAEAAWHQLAPASRVPCTFEVAVGRGRGRLSFSVAQAPAEAADAVEFVAIAGYLHLDRATAASLAAGDLIAFEPLQPARLLGQNQMLACRVGAHEDRYAICIEEAASIPPSSDAGGDEVVLSVELGRVVLAAADSAALTPGTTVRLAQRLDAPLRAMRDGACYAHVEILELAGGFAVHILERT